MGTAGPVPEAFADNPTASSAASTAAGDGSDTAASSINRSFTPSYLQDATSASAMGLTSGARSVSLGRHESIKFVSVRNALPKASRRPLTAGAVRRMQSEAGLSSSTSSAAAAPAHVLPNIPREVELNLREGLARVPTGDRQARLKAHRVALHDLIRTLEDPSAQAVLTSVMHEYDALQFDKLDKDICDLAERLREKTAAEQQAQQKVKLVNARVAQQQLQIENLRRQLEARNDVLEQISVTYNVSIPPLAGTLDTGSGSAAAAGRNSSSSGATSCSSGASSPKARVSVAAISRRMDQLESMHGSPVLRARRDGCGNPLEQLNADPLDLSELMPRFPEPGSATLPPPAHVAVSEPSSRSKPPLGRYASESSLSATRTPSAAAGAATHLEMYRAVHGVDRVGVDLEANVPADLVR